MCFTDGFHATIAYVISFSQTDIHSPPKVSDYQLNCQFQLNWKFLFIVSYSFFHLKAKCLQNIATTKAIWIFFGEEYIDMLLCEIFFCAVLDYTPASLPGYSNTDYTPLCITHTDTHSLSRYPALLLGTVTDIGKNSSREIVCVCLRRLQVFFPPQDIQCLLPSTFQQFCMR